MRLEVRRIQKFSLNYMILMCNSGLIVLTQKGISKELQDLNADTIRTDIPTSATVTNVLVWNVEHPRTDDFTVAYEVDQQVKEGEQTQAVT